MRPDRIVAGWSRTTIALDPSARVLDLGCGAFPNARADVACDGSLAEDRHRTGRATVVDRPFVLADAHALPFRDAAFDFVLASHIAEHVDDPATFCAELARVATAGYVETPSPLADVLLDEEYHVWRVGRAGDAIRFRGKRSTPRPVRWFTDGFYRAFYAGRATGERPTWRLPGGVVGRVLALLLYVVRGVLNRSGVMHTRVRFGPDRPLRWVVEPADRPEVLFVHAARASGFLTTDLACLRADFTVHTVAYPGRPTLGYLLAAVRAVRRSGAVVAFFASEHAVVPALLGRALGRRVVVVVGGYDVADERELRYGLAANGQGWLPRLVLRTAHVVLPFSESAANELRALAPSVADRARTAHLAVDERTWRSPGVARDEDQVVTVGYVDTLSWRRKGIDRFVALARQDPDRRYVLAGDVDPAIERLVAAMGGWPANLRRAGFLGHDALRRLLWSSGTYVQLSRHEGFGVAVAEAMLCGCVPVVADHPALREVAGEWAVVADPGHEAKAVLTAVETPVDRAAMRRAVATRFSMGRRRAALRRAVSGAG